MTPTSAAVFRKIAQQTHPLVPPSPEMADLGGYSTMFLLSDFVS